VTSFVIPAVVGSRATGDPVAPDPAVTYPAVAGDLGIHLAELQDAVAGTGLEATVLTATVAAADGDYESASQLLDAVSALAADALESGAIDEARAERIEDAIHEAKSDLRDLIKDGDDGEGDEGDDSPGNSGNGNGGKKG
jgi:hypothetical protein